MKSIGVRELRQQASRHLRSVQEGETIQVTDRGKPVAMIVPVASQDSLARLESAGRLKRGKGDLLKHWPPLKPKQGVPTPSEILRKMRADER